MKISAGLAVLLAASPALAARVAVVPFRGEADPALVRQAEELTRTALGERRDAVATADEVARATRGLGVQSLETTDQHLRLGRALNVDYVVAGRVTPLAGQFNLSITVYQVSDGRTEVLEDVVVLDRAEELVAGMLERLLRPGGLGETPEPPAPEPPVTAPQPPAPTKQPTPTKRAARPAAPPAPPEPLLSYTPDSPLGLRGGLGIGFVLGDATTDRGSTVGAARAQVGYMLAYKFGLEARGTVTIGFGTAGSFSLLVGAGLTPPILRGVPLYLGGGVDLGLLVNVSGGRDAFFQLRPSLRAVYVIAERFELIAEPVALTLLFGPETHTILELGAMFGVRIAI